MAINCSSWRQKKLHIEYIYSLGKLQGHQVGELSFSDLQEGECVGNLPFSPFPLFPLFFSPCYRNFFLARELAPHAHTGFPLRHSFSFLSTVSALSSFLSFSPISRSPPRPSDGTFRGPTPPTVSHFSSRKGGNISGQFLEMPCPYLPIPKFPDYPSIRKILLPLCPRALHSWPLKEEEERRNSYHGPQIN